MSDLPINDITTNFLHFEPVNIMDGLRGSLYRISNSIIDTFR